MKFDFLIWSGLLSDFERVAQNNVLKDEDRTLFSNSEAAHAASSIVDLNASDRGPLTNIYVQNWDVSSYSDTVAVDVDLLALTKVTFLVILIANIKTNHDVPGYT